MSSKKEEAAWNKAKAATKKQYPDLADDDPKFYKIAKTILKKILGKNESFTDYVDSQLEDLDMIIEINHKKNKDDENEDDENEDDDSNEKEMSSKEKDDEKEEIDDEETSEEDKKKKKKK